MKRSLFTVILITLFSTLSFGQNVVSDVVGTYRYCTFPCETIKLNDDFTFNYLLHGDLFNNERTEGKWKFVGKNKIHLKSPEKQLIFQVEEKRQENDNNKIFVQAVDQAGAIIPDVTIKFNHLGKDKQIVTNEDGFCEIPKTDLIEVSWLKLSGKYKIKDTKNNYLLLIVELQPEPSLDDIFILKNGKLYKIYEDKTLSDGYKKINPKFSNKLFPKK